MHYFKHGINERGSETIGYTMLHHGAYDLILDACYKREDFPTSLAESVIWIRCRAKIEIKALDYVLQSCFIFVDNKYIHKRVQSEINAYQNSGVAHKEAALRGWKRKKESIPPFVPTSTEPTPIKKPRVAKKNQHDDVKVLLSSLGVSDQIINDYFLIRKAKKLPPTLTAINAIVSEAKLAGMTAQDAFGECCARGWIGFKASWLQEKATAKPFEKTTKRGGIDDFGGPGYYDNNFAGFPPENVL